MPRGDSRQAIVDSAMQGIYKAAKEWESMSGLWLEAAPEYFVRIPAAMDTQYGDVDIQNGDRGH